MSVRWTEGDLRAYEARNDALESIELETTSQRKRTKYGNRKCQYRGETFDSEGERGRWIELALMQHGGFITDLRRQVRYEINVNRMYICSYVADFVYVKDGQMVIEDYKSKATRTPVYMLKKRLIRAVFGLEIREVYREDVRK